MAFDHDDNQPDSEAAPEKAAHGRPRRRFATRTQFSSTPMTSEDLHAVEQTLAQLVARAFVADHPYLFRRCRTDQARQGEEGQDSA
jgi:hypothetical protein